MGQISVTECKVVCQQCRTDQGRAKTWRWLCEICAEECLTKHRDETGHTDIELSVTQKLDAADVMARIQDRRAYWTARKFGW